MNNSIASNNNLNFQAKLDISKVRGSKQRWQNIARMFEEKTKKSPNDILELSGSFNQDCVLDLMKKGEPWLWEQAQITSAGMAKLKKLSDKEIVKNIVDVFNLLKKHKADTCKRESFAKQLKLEELDKAQKTNFDERLTDWLTDIMRVEEKEFIKKHPVFHNEGILF